MSANPMDGWFHINGTWMMTAQERKDVRRVQKARDIWKTRAVGRGEERRRLRESRKEVACSREAWRARALAAANRPRELTMATHQRTSALTRVPEPPTIDTTHFFFSDLPPPSRVALSPLVPRLSPSSPFMSSGWGWPALLGASLHDAPGLGLTSRLPWLTTGSAPPRWAVGWRRRVDYHLWQLLQNE